MTKLKLKGKALSEARLQAEPYIGVSVDLCNPNKPFKAVFARKHLGYFDNALNAAMAFNKYSKTQYGTAALAKKENRWNTISK